jgi:hypothetical protein
MRESSRAPDAQGDLLSEITAVSLAATLRRLRARAAVCVVTTRNEAGD